MKLQLSILFSILTFTGFSQSKDSLQKITIFSGSVGLTNNGFSIIPTFSLNSPATIINLSWRKNKFSIEPDVRLVPNLSKGGILIWLRYRIVENKKFNLRVGTHPAFSLIKRTISENGVKSEITEMLRFAAFEVVPNYQIMPNWSLGGMYLSGFGLQKHGPQRTNVLFLNTAITNLKLGENFRFSFIPMVYFLKIDTFNGNYFSTTSILANKKLPFNLQSTINKTISSNIPGNKDFMWNVSVNYTFKKRLKQII